MTFSTAQMMLVGTHVIDKEPDSEKLSSYFGVTRQLAKHRSNNATHARAIAPNTFRKNHSMLEPSRTPP
jgi:hypothetical protein